MLAAALKDYGITIVGTNTYGKGIMQWVPSLGDGEDGFQFTYAQYFFPSGKEVHGIGITPDKAMQQKMEPFATEIVSSLEKITVDQGYRGGINYGKNDIRH